MYRSKKKGKRKKQQGQRLNRNGLEKKRIKIKFCLKGVVDKIIQAW